MKKRKGHSGKRLAELKVVPDKTGARVELERFAANPRAFARAFEHSD